MKSFLGRVATAALFVAVSGAQPVLAQDLAAKTLRIRDLVQAAGHTQYVVPAPGSRSNIISVDVSTQLFFFMERGSIRGAAVDGFYAALEADDMEGAAKIFNASALMTMRATDYGWNGLGVPMTTDSGNEIADILFKDMGGTFRRAETISPEDLAAYEAMLDAVLAALVDS